MKKQNSYVKAAFAKRLKKILGLRALGMTYTEVGAAVGLSAERIRQIVAASRAPADSLVDSDALL